jgi:hypothetical protein
MNNRQTDFVFNKLGVFIDDDNTPIYLSIYLSN